MRAHDWSASPLGRPETWPGPLRTVVGIMLSANQPMFAAWGPEQAMLYNDGYIDILGARHPAALGRPFREVWSELGDTVWPIMDRACAGEPTAMDDIELVLTRNGYEEEAHFSFFYAPLRDETGAVGGMYCACVEITAKVFAERRTAFRLVLDERLRGVADPAEVMAAAADALSVHLRVARVGYAEVDADGFATVEREWNADGLPSLVGRHRLDDYGRARVADMRAGRIEVITDFAADPRLSPSDVAMHHGLGIGAQVVVPLVKEGGLVALLFVHAAAPRQWHPDEVAVVADAAERTWAAVERARAEAALRESEARYRAVVEAIDEAVMVIERLPLRPDGLRDWRYVAMNPATQRMFGTADLTGQSVRDNFPDEDEGWYDIYDRALETGEVARFEREAKSQGMFLQMYVSRVDAPERGRVTAVIQDVTERVAAEAALRVRQERQAFLLRLNDALRPLDDAEEIRLAAAEVLGRHLGASRVAYAENVGDEFFDVRRNYVDGAAEVVGRYTYADYGVDIVAELKAGRMRVQPDIANDTQLSDVQKAALASARVGASLNVPLVKGGELVAFLGVNYPTAHDFDPTEIELIQEVAERTWATVERARAETATRESEARLRALVTSAGPIVWRSAADGFMLEAPGWEALTGQPPEALRGAGWLEVVHPEDRAPTLEAWGAGMTAGGPVRTEHRVRGRDGGWRRVEAFAAPVRDTAGTVIEWIGTVNDIHERREAEKALRESEQRFRAVQDTSIDGFMLLNAVRDGMTGRIEDFRWMHANEAAERIVGRPRNWFLGKRLLEEMPGNRETGLFDAYLRVVETGEPWSDEVSYRHDGVDVFLRIAAAKAGDGFAVTFADLSARRRAEEALRESEARYRQLFETMDEGFCVIEFLDGPHGPLSDYVHVEANPAYARHAGIPDVVGQKLRDMVPGEAEEWLDRYRPVLVTGKPIRFVQELVATGRCLELSAFRIEPASRRQVAVLFQDVTGRKRAEAALRELNATLERRVAERTAERDRVWRNARDLIAVSDPEGRFVALNPAWTAILGWTVEEAIGQPAFRFVHPDDVEPTYRAVATAAAGPLPVFENRYRHKDGGWRVISWVAAPEDGRIYAQCYTCRSRRPALEWGPEARPVHVVLERTPFPRRRSGLRMG